ncbi:MAG: helicase C-terminal domain-containing protein [Candidatus Margulisiibacteriota bacterium]|jgi:ATP-dependent DNA helicase DinG
MAEANDITFIVVDVETTGLTPELNEIIEISLVKIKKQKIVDKYTSLIHPEKHIPHYVSTLTGITDKMLVTAPAFTDIVGKILPFFKEENVVFVGHNVQFDYDMLNATLQRAGYSRLYCPVLDTQFLASLFFPRLASYKLGSIAKAMGVKADNLHRAEDDALITAKILLKSLQKIKKFPLELVQEINKILRRDQSSWPLKDTFYALELAAAGKTMIKPRGWEEFLKGKETEKNKRTRSGQAIISVDEKELVAKLEEDKLTSKIMTNYESRDQQKAMLGMVCQAFNDGNHLIVEAGTGTGKSLAYLLPAAAFAVKNGRPVVISTKTKTLQTQLLEQDIPLAEKILKINFKTALIKGRENYICLRKFNELLHGAASIKLIPLLVWLYATRDGDFSECHNDITWSFRDHLKAQTSTCLGERCPFKKYCFVNAVRREAEAADIIIVNHSLLFIDAKGDNFLMPEYQELIIDEAHAAEDVATSCYSYQVSGRLINEALNKLPYQVGHLEAVQMLRESCKQACSDFDRVLRKYFKAFEAEKILFNEEICQGKIWLDIVAQKNALIAQLQQLVMVLKQLDLDRESINADLKGTINGLEMYQDALFFVFEPERHYISWGEINTRTNPANVKVISSPSEISRLLDQTLFTKKRSVVLTSATLTVNNNFDYIVRRLGLNLNNERTVVEAASGSPFDYKQQTLLCIPRDLPDPHEEAQFIPAIAEYINELIKVTQGKTLVLFTSYRMLEETFSLVDALNKHKYLLLCQGKNLSRNHVLDIFKKETNSVLFGTDSFWEGVDVPGISLSCVVIVKIPFFVPSDPLVMARTQAIKDNGGNGFYEYAIPQAVVKFKQGFGRLIRNKDDKGVVVILDNRLLFKSYGSVFIRSLPACEYVTGPQEDTLNKIREWLK